MARKKANTSAFLSDLQRGGEKQMDSNKNSVNMWIIGTVVVFALLGGGYFLFRGNTGSQNQTSTLGTTQSQPSPAETAQEGIKITPPEGYTDKITLAVNGKDYTYGPIPAHFWKKDGENNILGTQYNGDVPFAWASDVAADTKLYDVEGVVGTCKNGYQADRPQVAGFVHYHATNEDKNVGYWLKHSVVTAFTWAGPPGNPDVGRKVAVGTDNQFPNICEGGPA